MMPCFFQLEIEMLDQKAKEEQTKLEKTMEEGRMRKELQHQKAATKIQSVFRGHRYFAILLDSDPYSL